MAGDLPPGARERYARSLQERLLHVLETGGDMHPAANVAAMPTPRERPQLSARGRPASAVRAGGSSLRLSSSTAGASSAYLRRLQLQMPNAAVILVTPPRPLTSAASASLREAATHGDASDRPGESRGRGRGGTHGDRQPTANSSAPSDAI
jgi:hypothetical protein